MANLESDFLNFYEKVKLSSSKKDELRQSRNIIRTAIKEHFQKVLEEPIPKFYSQGSFAMGTTITPLNEEYDIDDGVYINDTEIDFNNSSTWPSAEEVHVKILEACNPNARNVVDKDPCVRVIYAKQYHVDLPIYIKDLSDDNFIPKLAHKKKGWMDSDPRGNTDHYKAYEKKYGEILKRLIVYIKAMKDYQEINFDQTIEISGFEITLLCCREVDKLDLTNNDEQILYDLCDCLIISCEKNTPLYKPITEEDLWKIKTQDETDNIVLMFEYAKDLLEKAINETDIEIARKTCSDIFGDRFYKKTSFLLFPFGSLTHKKGLEWNINIRGTVSITATYKIRDKVLPYKSTLLSKGSSIWFTANVNNIIGDYIIKWQITNTGNEAMQRSQLRGDKFEDSNHGKYIRTETAEFRGTHIVQCFIIQNDVCIAKSNEFLVNIV